MLLQRLKSQKLRVRWPACRQPFPYIQRQDKHVEGLLALYSDGGSTPPISTKQARGRGLFLWFFARIRAVRYVLKSNRKKTEKNIIA